MKTRRATIIDVAARANVSIATVSLVVNKNGFVSERLTKRVLEAMDELGYHPNAVARSLRRQSTETVGVIIPSLMSPFFPPILKETENVLSAAGYSMILANTREDERTEAQLISLMRAKRVDGLLFAPHTFATNIPLLEDMVHQGIPVVTFHHDTAQGRLDCVTWDDYRASHDAVRHLIETGRRRIAILGLRYRGRLRGYEAALNGAGIPLDQSLYLPGSSDETMGQYSSGHDAVVAAMQGPAPIDGIFVSGSGDLTVGVLSGAKDVGARIPEDLAVVAFANYLWMEHFAPPITVVARDSTEMGRIAAETLLRRLAEKGDSPSRPETIVLSTELLVRASTERAPRTGTSPG